MIVINSPEILREEVFEKKYDEEKYLQFLREIFGSDLGYSYKDEEYENFKILGNTYLDDKEIALLSVEVENENKLENVRKYHHQTVMKFLKEKEIDSAIVAFYCPGCKNWRISLFYREHIFDNEGNLITKESPYKRFSFLLGEDEPSYTPTKQLWKLIEKRNKEGYITFEDIKEAFSVEKLTDEFFQKYRKLYLKLKEHIEKQSANSKLINNLKRNGYSVEDFSKKLLGQLVFLYFLQKKGWLGVPEGKPYGEGDKKFLRNLFEKAKQNNQNYYLEYLIPLFYETLNNPREKIIPDWSDYFNCRIPFLNGGLFEPIYDYKNINISIDNEIFSNENEDGILDIFDTYNFTAKEDEPLEKEVAVDPEMLGKVFENLISENERKGQGAFYTPREIVHYMSQQSIIYYLSDKLDLPVEEVKTIFTEENFENLPESIKKKAKEIDNEIKNLKIVDPACGSGAFLVGALHEVIKARSLLNKEQNKSHQREHEQSECEQDFYKFKKEAIENSIYGVDIDIGATEIAKLRLWLSLIVDEENPYKIEPLPNLEYKIMCGNSLLEELVIGDEVISLSVEAEYKKDIVSQIKILEKELEDKRKTFFELARAKGKSNKEVKDLEKEIKKLEKKIKELKDKPQQGINATLLGIADLNEAFEEIKKLQHQFFNEHNPEKKRQLKEKIDEKLKEFVLRKIEEEENKLWNKIKQISNKYAGRKMPSSEEKKINKYTKILQELDNYKQKLNFRGCNKNFFLWHLNFSEVFRERGGFDIVIANPPYVRQEAIREEKAKFKAVKYQVYNSTADLYTYFYERAYQILSNGGIYSFITSNKFMRAKYGKELREFLKNNTKIKNIIDFGGYQVFETATVDTAILIGEKSKPNGNSIHVCLIQDDFNNETNIYDYCKEKGFEFPQEKLLPEVWTFEDLDIKEKIEKIGIPLKDWDVNIYRGVLTGFNEAFIINEETRQKILNNCKTEEERKRTEEIIKPVLRGRDIKRYYYKWAGLYLIATFPSLNLNIDDYPALKEYLKSFGKKLEQTGKTYIDSKTGKKIKTRKKTSNKWFETQDNIAYWKEFEKEKIVWQEIVREPSFAFDTKGFYPEATTFIMTGKSLKYLLAILNSYPVAYFFKQFYAGGGLGEEGYRYKKAFLEKLPIPKITEDQQKPFIELVDKILELTNHEDYQYRPELQAKVQEYTSQIDQLVYKLYNLTDEEIERIERRLKN